MTISNVKKTFPFEKEKVWGIVTDLKEYAWRGDLSKIERVSESVFVEYTKDGYTTTFTITGMELYRRWEFDMENENMRGHWTGLFTEENGSTTLDFTEAVTAKKVWMRPFLKMFLKKQQAAYLQDLEKALSHSPKR